VPYILQGLSQCQPLPSRPKFIPKARLRGSRAAGVTYEKKVGKVLRHLFGTKAVHSGVWFEYADSVRQGVCQVDHYVLREEVVLLIECKLSESLEAWGQMRDLYAPILRRAYGLPVTCIQATKCLRSGLPVIFDPRETRSGGTYLWHVLA
jgi:hypothetical protein